MKRISSIDVIRGVAMIIMALDHTRDLIHINSITQSPTDLATTTPLLFFTRFITHLCAPTFVFLSGTSAFISFNKKDNIAESKKYLFTRGIWLILLDLTLVNFGVWFDIHFAVILFNVLSAIGTGFIILGFLLNTSAKTIGIIGLLIIALHNLVPLIPFDESSFLKIIIMPFFSIQAFPIGSKTTFVIGYPPVPWLGITLVGFSAGRLFEFATEKRKKNFLKIGTLGLLLFLILRFTNFYGDPIRWTSQKNDLFTLLSFTNVTKYPPSLLFCLLTLGTMFIMLFFAEGLKNKLTDIAIIYGKVPLFYFVVHWYIIHAIMFLIVFLQGYKSSDLTFGFNFGRPKSPSGTNLWMVYAIWIFVVVLLYPLCKWYGYYKENNREKKWLSYL